MVKRGFDVRILPAENMVRLSKYTKMGRSKIGVEIGFGSTELEMRRSPMQRRTLYFHQLRDFDKHVRVEMPGKGAPGNI